MDRGLAEPEPEPSGPGEPCEPPATRLPQDGAQLPQDVTQLPQDVTQLPQDVTQYKFLCPEAGAPVGGTHFWNP